MSIRHSMFGGLAALAMISAVISGCGGSTSGDAGSQVVPPAPSIAAIEGIATPSSVAVVTATNAQ